MSGVFISYRRNDSSWFARSLFDALRAAFPGHTIFIDVEGIDAGLDFVDVINERLSSCEVLLTIIGRKWLEETASDGSRRIDDPNDNVRAEIEAALQRKIRVIPVLVDGAQIPSQRDLPESLASLSRRNGLEITHARFSSDTTRLVDVLSSVLPLEPSNVAKASDVTKPRGFAEVRQSTERVQRPRRWLIAGTTALVPVVALSAVFFAHAWRPSTASDDSTEKVASMTLGAPYAIAPSADPPVETGRSSATAPEASVPYIFHNAYGQQKTPDAPALVASTEPGAAQPPSMATDPLSFKSLPKIEVVDKIDLDTDKASVRLRIGAGQLVSRRAECESLTVHAEFGSYSIVDKLTERLSSAKGCFFKTSWKDQQSGAIADNVLAERARVLNQTLRLLCPNTFGNIVGDCRTY